MKRKPGLGDRIRQRLLALGYWKAGRPDVLRFCDERRYNHVYIYRYLKDSTPEWENLDRLAADLGVSPEWLLFGDAIYKRNAPPPSKRPRHPVAGGSGSGDYVNCARKPPTTARGRRRTIPYRWTGEAGCAA